MGIVLLAASQAINVDGDSKRNINGDSQRNINLSAKNDPKRKEKENLQTILQKDLNRESSIVDFCSNIWRRMKKYHHDDIVAKCTGTFVDRSSDC